jgi:hypothetical protein
MKEDIIRMAREAQLPYYYRTGEVSNLDQLERFAALVRADEREECAKYFAEHWRETWTDEQIAEAIRARTKGEKNT